jgi:signal transduction histidine kinase
MSPDHAVASGATLAPDSGIKGEASRRVLAEQLELLCRQWVRLPLPMLLLCLYVGYLVWGYVHPAMTVGWAAALLGGIVGRSAYLTARRAQIRQQPQAWAGRLVVSAFVSGMIAGSAALLFFNALPPDRQALLTMVMCCWGAGGIATSGAYPRAYYAFALPMFAQIAVVWLQPGVPGAWFISVLLCAFLAVMIIFVRDNGRMVVDSIRLRFANEELLAQKEQLIGLLRAEFDKAEGARTKAEEASRSKSQFLAAASHDLRQPLHALSLLTALLNELTEDSRVREVGGHIGQSVQSLDRLFGALLDLSKLDAGVVKPDLRELDLAELLGQLSIEYRPKAQEKGLAYEARCEPMWLRADAILLERVVRNLLENAIRFTDSGRVVLEARRAASDAVISVSDTGPGIAKSEQGRVFEEFYQLGNPGRDRSKGLGLGLSIVRRLVDLLGYSIALDSSPGRGTSFTLTLAGAALAARPRTAPQQQAPAMQDVRGLKVLLVEDDAEAQRAMQMTLQRWGCETLAAASLEEARAALAARGTAVDVILSDFRLANGADGIQAIQALREQFGPMPAALLTGDISGERLLELRASGLPVLHKPVRADALRELLHNLAHTGE